MSGETTISVRGTATMEVPPDRAELRVGASHLAPTRDEALAAVDQVATALRETLGATDGVESVTISRVRCSAEHDYSAKEPRLVGFRATLAGTARCAPGAVPRAAAVVGGCRADLLGVDWLLDDDNVAHREVRKAAVGEARRAAEDFADAIGRPLGPLFDLADVGLLGDYAPEPRGVAHMAMASSLGSSDAEVELDPEPVEIRATVEARFTA